MVQFRLKIFHPFVGLLLVLLLLVPLAVLVSIWASHFEGKRRVAVELSHFQEMGFQIDEAALWESFHRVHQPAEENAAFELEKAFPLIQTDRDTWRDLPPPSEWGEAEVRTEVTAILNTHAETLELLHRASDRPYLRFSSLQTDTDFHRRHNMLREGGRLLRVEAIHRAHEGEVGSAIDSITAIFRLASMLGDEPKLWSQFTVIAILHAGYTALEEVLKEDSVGPENLLTMERMLEAIEYESLAKNAVQGEIVEGSEWIESFFEDHGLLFFIHNRTGLHLHDEAIFLAQLKVILNARDQPDRLAGLKASYDDFTINPLSAEKRWVISSRLRVVASLMEARLVNIAMHRMLRTMLAMERFRGDHGYLPNDLAPLIPEYLAEAQVVDPFSGKAFRLYSDNGSLVIESTGTFMQGDEERKISKTLPRER